MVLVMGSDGTLTPSRSQDSFMRHYQDGIAVGQDDRSLATLETPDAAEDPDIGHFAQNAHTSVRPTAEVLGAIEAAGLRYANHPGLRRAALSVTDWLLIYRANIEVESAYRQEAVSSVGAIGLGQLMPATAKELGVDPRDPLQNLDGSARYLAAMLHEFGNPELALAAYNAGPAAVHQYGDIPPYSETRNHVARVLAVFTRLKGSYS